MADSSLRASDDAVTLTIPAAYYDRFRTEALFSLGSSADTIGEVTKHMRWAMDDEKEPVRALTPTELERFDAARAVWLQVWDIGATHDVRVTGDRETLRSAAVGCQLEVADQLKGAAEDEVDTSAPLVDEFKFWAELRDQLAPAEVVS